MRGILFATWMWSYPDKLFQELDKINDKLEWEFVENVEADFKQQTEVIQLLGLMNSINETPGFIPNLHPNIQADTRKEWLINTKNTFENFNIEDFFQNYKDKNQTSGVQNQFLDIYKKDWMERKEKAIEAVTALELKIQIDDNLKNASLLKGISNYELLRKGEEGKESHLRLGSIFKGDTSTGTGLIRANAYKKFYALAENDFEKMIITLTLLQPGQGKKLVGKVCEGLGYSDPKQAAKCYEKVVKSQASQMGIDMKSVEKIMKQLEALSTKRDVGPKIEEQMDALHAALVKIEEEFIFRKRG